MTEPLGPDDLVLCSGTLPRDTSFRQRVEVAVAAGYSGISMWARDYRRAITDGFADADIRPFLADHGLAVAELDPAWWWLPGAEEIGARIPEAVDDQQVFGAGEHEMFRIADLLGARSINAVDVFGAQWTLDDAAEAFAGLCDRAAEHGLLVHIEFLPWSRIPDVATALEIITKADRPNGGMAVDAWHLARSGGTPDDIRAVPGDRVLGVQVNDGPAAPESDLLHATLHERRLPGAGDFPLTDLVAALQDIGATAPMGVEVFSDDLHALGARSGAQISRNDAPSASLSTHMTRPFRFGVITSHAPDGKAWRERARRAEALGYSTLFMPDHFQEQWAPIVGLTVAAEATDRLNVGTLVFDNDYRHPVVLAKEIATLDLATEGRVEFGLGAGWKRTDYEESGIAYDRPGTRIDRMAEALTVMKALWSSQEPVHFRGEHYEIAGAVGTPSPHSTPYPPVCIGGGGRKVLSIAAREATIVGINATLTSGALDGSMLPSITPSAFDERVGWIREAAGDRFDDIELQSHCAMVMVQSDGRAIAEQMAQGFGVAPEEANDIPIALMGTVEELVDTIERRRERWGFTYWVVPDDAMDAFAPVVARLA